MSTTEPALSGGSGSLETRLRSYRRLADVFHAVASEPSLDVLLERVADALGELIGYDTLSVYRTHAADPLPSLLLRRDPSGALGDDRALAFEQSVVGGLAARAEPLDAGDRRSHAAVREDRGGWRIAIPLKARGSLKGVLSICRLGGDGFSQADVDIAGMSGDILAMALDNADAKVESGKHIKSDPLTGLYNHRYFHERVEAELVRAARVGDSVAVLIIDVDNFKAINDVHGHATGDDVLVVLAEILAGLVRASDVVCRLGGDEFGIVMPSCDGGDALGLATRIADRVAKTDLDPVGGLTVSIGIAQGPDHAAEPRALIACAGSAVRAGKARGNDRVVLFDPCAEEREDLRAAGRNVRSAAQMKMLQSLAGKLSRLNDVAEIGSTIAKELRTLIDYHRCVVYVRHGDVLTPVAVGGKMSDAGNDPDKGTCRVGSGVAGRVARTGRSMLAGKSSNFEAAVRAPELFGAEGSVLAVPLDYGGEVIGVIVVTAVEANRLDEEDLRLLEVLSGHASVALENARLYESEKREADNAKALLDLAGSLSRTDSLYTVCNETVTYAGHLMGAPQTTLWLQNDRTGEFCVEAHHGYKDETSADRLICKRIPALLGDELLAAHDGPAVLKASESDRWFGEPASVGAIAIAPLNGIRGWIMAQRPGASALYFHEDRMRLFAGVSHQASMAIHKALLYREQKETAEIANALLEFSREMSSCQSLEEVLDRLAARAAQILGSPKTYVCLQEPGGDLRVKEAWGYDGEERDELLCRRIPFARLASMFESRSPFIVTADDLERLSGAGDGRTGHDLVYAIAPIHLDDSGYGCIVVSAPAFGRYEFSERKMRLLAGIAYHAKLAIVTASSFETLETTFLSTVEALANALEAKDEYTSSHARWISDMSLEVGDELGLDTPALKRLELAALFHDIGKIGIPSEILLKPGPLTEEEWAVVRQHPELGEKILAPIERLSEVRHIVRHCHEHFDGSGYPDGKRGRETPVEARIILVVDAFHAMTSDRTYRKALPSEEACRRLRRAAGSQFDPEIVDAFLRALPRRMAVPA